MKADRKDLGTLRRRTTRTRSTPVPRIRTLSDRARAAQNLALMLLAQHGLQHWRFDFNRRKGSMGLCVHSRRIIELSIHFVERNPMAEIRDTILHEIAHALVGARHGHDEVWKRKCLEVGARPERCGIADMPKGKWQAHCDGCSTSFHRHRKPVRTRGWFCRSCGPQKGKLVWKLAS